jgi:putative DNA primase/helicase
MRAGELNDLLARQALQLAQELLPMGRKQGAEWAVSGSRSPVGYAISVCVAGGKRGLVGFWGRAKEGGDLIGLIREVKGLDIKGACDWASAWLGLGPQVEEDAEAKAERDRRAAKFRAASERRQVAQDQRKSNRALDIWRRGVPIEGTLAERYLLGRGLTKRAWPPTLRFVDSIEWTQGAVFKDGEKIQQGPFFPALIAVLQDVERRAQAIWRIYLDENGGKAPVEPNKVGLGPAAGCACRLGPVAEQVNIGEGLETCLAISEMDGYAGTTWATLSTSGMMNVILPPQVKVIHIFCDNDFPKGAQQKNAGEHAGFVLRDRALAEGRKVVMEPPPPVGQDYLELLKGLNGIAGQQSR